MTAPIPLPKDTRRRFPWAESARGLRVPLWTATAEGDVHTGFLKVTKRLAEAQDGTDARHEFLTLLSRHIARWVEWKAKKGWKMEGRPRVRGPYAPPTAGPDVEAEDACWYWISARFTRIAPEFVLLDDFLHLHDQAKRYGVDLNQPKPFQTPLPPSKAEITPEDAPHDPMAFAAARRERLGIRREPVQMPENAYREDEPRTRG